MLLLILLEYMQKEEHKKIDDKRIKNSSKMMIDAFWFILHESNAYDDALSSEFGLLARKL